MSRTKAFQRLDRLAQVIYDKRGMNIIALDMREFSTLTDYYLIAEGNVERHVTALASAVLQSEKERGIQPLHVEGMNMGDWIVIDYGEVIIHLLHPDLREKYALEKLWKAAQIIDLKIAVHKDKHHE